MSSSGLDWKPVAHAWLKKRSARENEVFMNLFQHSFEDLYTWGTQSVVLTMKVLQCNIVLQVSERIVECEAVPSIPRAERLSPYV